MNKLELLQENAEMCARFAAALAYHGNQVRAMKYVLRAESYWQQWIAAKEQSTQVASVAA